MFAYSDHVGIRERVTLCGGIKKASEFFKIGQRGTKLQIWMMTIHQDVDQSLRGTSIVDHLLGEE